MHHGPRQSQEEDIRKKGELIDFLKECNLSVRATNILLTHIKSWEDLSLLNEKILYSFPNCGRKSVDEILNLLAFFHLNGNGKESVSKREDFSNPPSESTLALLPIFSNKTIEGLLPEQMHPDFNALIKINDIPFSARTFHVLSKTGMTIIGEVMLTTPSELLRWKDLGKKSLDEIKDVIRSLSLSGTYNPHQKSDIAASIDFRSYQNMISDFCSVCFEKKRDQELFKRKLDFKNGKGPTLEALGNLFGLSKQRVRQIIDKEIRKFKHRINSDTMNPFWEKLDQIIINGGGIAYLQELPEALKKAFKWPEAPYSLAIGQLISLRYPDMILKQATDCISLDCHCTSCEKLSEWIGSLDLSTSMHVAVLKEKLKNRCVSECPWNTPVHEFHTAFIIELVHRHKNQLALQGDLVMNRAIWLEKYCKNMEDVACRVLEANGSPLHFRDIADQIRKKNLNFKELSDHNLHAAIQRYDRIEIVNRGVYGLKSWKLENYRSVSRAIEEFINSEGLPQRRQNIIGHLYGEFSEGNITAALSNANRFQAIGEGFYDRLQTWQKRKPEDLIEILPHQLAEFARYLTSRSNNTSYKLVMALLFVRSMDDCGTLYFSKLKSSFYNFYHSRYKKELQVELPSASMSRIGEWDKNEIINQACKRPIESFIKSNYFSFDNLYSQKLKLSESIFLYLRDTAKRDLLLIILMKAIDLYYLKMYSPTVPLYQQPPEIHWDALDSSSAACLEISSSDSDSDTSGLHIRKRQRGKIRL